MSPPAATAAAATTAAQRGRCSAKNSTKGDLSTGPSGEGVSLAAGGGVRHHVCHAKPRTFSRPGVPPAVVRAARERRPAGRAAPLSIRTTTPTDPLARDAKTARVEAALFVADEPLTARRLAEAAGLADAAEAPRLIEKLRGLYDADGSAFQDRGTRRRLSAPHPPGVPPVAARASAAPGTTSGSPARDWKRSPSSPTSSRSRGPMSRPSAACSATRSSAC